MTRVVLVLMLVAGFVESVPAAEEFGHVTGRIARQGAPPVLRPLIGPGLVALPCGLVAPVPDESLLVGPQGGVANVMIYLRRAPAVIHPDLQAVPEEPAKVEIQGMRYIPHASFVRAGQGVEVTNRDPCVHNVHPLPIRNHPIGTLLPPNPKGAFVYPFPRAELQPIQVKCSVHAWMSAHWLILDHPYAAITKADGSFEIRNLPVGRHAFRVWHERAGYLERALVVNIAAGRTENLGTIAFEAEAFE